MVNDEEKWLVTLPYKVGLSVGIVGALTSVPLIFHLDTVIWFNEVRIDRCLGIHMYVYM